MIVIVLRLLETRKLFHDSTVDENYVKLLLSASLKCMSRDSPSPRSSQRAPRQMRAGGFSSSLRPCTFSIFRKSILLTCIAELAHYNYRERVLFCLVSG